MHINAKATPTNDTDYHCYKNCRGCLIKHMGSISHHIMPLVNSSLRGEPTHTHARTHTHTHIHLRRNQECADHRLAHAWNIQLLIDGIETLLNFHTGT